MNKRPKKAAELLQNYSVTSGPLKTMEDGKDIPSKPRKGRWIQTYVGKKYFPLDPRPEEVDIKDIAHALALKCRFGGHCKRFYSVAEHSVRCVEYFDRHNHEKILRAGEYNVGDIHTDWVKFHEDMHEIQRWVLMHDAAEAYLADVPRPVKKCMPEFKELEEKNLEAIAEAFEMSYPIPERIDEYIKEADNALLMTERRDNMSNPPEKWDIDGIGIEPDCYFVIPMTAEEAERRFLDKFVFLFHYDFLDKEKE